MSASIDDLRRQFDEDLGHAESLDQVKRVRDKWLAREGGVITGEMKRLRDLPKEERPAFGQAMNQLREFAEKRIEELRATLQQVELQRKRKRLDVTLPG